MNATNRAVNRTLLLVTGLLLVAAGATAVTASAWPVVGESWSAGLAAAVTWMQDAEGLTRISDATTLSAFTIGLLALLLITVVIGLAVISKLGGGRSSTVVRSEPGEDAQGSVTIRQGFAADAITQSLTGHSEILASRVSAHRVRGTDVLHVSVTPRKNTSPVEVAATVTRLVDNLATLTGRETPTYVSVHSGIRSRLAADRPRVR
ncbi:hypothetical protein [Microbacterium suwonense]|uniref:Alkaline shock response membrane anchor protein AmaP n=1 Tax=Microbacterium suwonense TaxID=683047 RepID=A0ABN6WZR6_9MICO|nr:hypothetical protein [Microbacterium suwonense]BDZ37859.1 hypothetical protein GCM10025863_04730 [Microbacterium suwonense]